jgi:type 1 glutamine amidotransferase
MKLRFASAVVGLIGLSTAQAAFGADAPAHKAKVLFVTQSGGFHHSSVVRPKETLAPAEIALTQLGQQTGLFDVNCTQDCAADFTRDNLKNYDIVAFYTTTDSGKSDVLPIPPDVLEYFLNDWLKQKGHGFVGFHSATDTYHKTEPYWDMIGGTFNGHPWGAGTTVTITVDDPNFPASKPFGKEFKIKDEIYQYSHWQPEKVHVLMSLNMAKCNPKKPYQVPVSWVKDYGDGKVFYTNLGHRESTWVDKRFLASVEGGVRWILGLEKGDATPNPEVSKAEDQASKEAAAHPAKNVRHVESK